MLEEYYPRLPQDLERLIFERAAWEGRRGSQPVIKLLLVAKRVHEWVRPILYQVFIQLSRPVISFPDFGSYPSLKLEDVGKFAQHLITGGTPDEIEKLLSSCPNVCDLALWGEPETLKTTLPAIQRLPLKRLSSNFAFLTPDDFLGPGFSNITHLDIVRLHESSWDRWAVLTMLPRLSHVAINFQPLASGIVRKLLLSCELLQIFVILHHWMNIDPTDFFAIHDDRLVLMVAGDVRQDWANGADGLTDFWTTAELFSEARMRKQVFIGFFTKVDPTGN